MAGSTRRDDTTPPLEMRHRNLDPKVRYRVGAIHDTENPGKITLTANEMFVIHPLLTNTVQTMPLDFETPPEATAGGDLRLAGNSSGGRSLQVAEGGLVQSPK